MWINRDTVKAQEEEWRTNLRNVEVDGHLPAKRMIDGFEVSEEGALLEFLEISNSATARKVELEMWNDAMEKEYLRRNYL